MGNLQQPGAGVYDESAFPEDKVSPLGVNCAKRLLNYLQTKGFEEVAAVRPKLQALLEVSGECYLAKVVQRLSDAAERFLHRPQSAQHGRDKSFPYGQI